MSKLKDLTNQKFGYLTALKIDTNPKNQRIKWICICECGNYTSVASYQLTSGKTLSCGCKKHESKNQTHGMRHTRIYSIWCDMKKRCYNHNSKSYPNYGAKGIRICDEWLNNFEEFKNWSFNHGYSDNLTIDRIDNAKDYCPENCKWTTHAEQQRNRTNNVYLEHNGTKKTIAEWSRELNFNDKKAYRRYSNLRKSNKSPTFEEIFAEAI